MYSDPEYLFAPLITPGSRRKTSVKLKVGCPIRRSADQRVLSPPHGLSQSATSFIASCRLGIHRTPFLRLIRSRRGETREADRILADPAAPPNHPSGTRAPGQRIAPPCQVTHTVSVLDLERLSFECPARPLPASEG